MKYTCEGQTRKYYNLCTGTDGEMEATFWRGTLYGEWHSNGWRRRGTICWGTINKYKISFKTRNNFGNKKNENGKATGPDKIPAEILKVEPNSRDMDEGEKISWGMEGGDNNSEERRS